MQNNFPKARVNITLDVETHGVKQKKELPLKLLFLGDFSGGQSKQALEQRKRLTIDKHNFNSVMAEINPKLTLHVTSKIHQGDELLKVKLEFKSLKDFTPDNLACQIPDLARLVAMRNLLKDLRASILDNKQFRKTLESYLRQKSKSQTLLAEIKNTAPLIQYGEEEE